MTFCPSYDKAIEVFTNSLPREEDILDQLRDQVDYDEMEFKSIYSTFKFWQLWKWCKLIKIHSRYVKSTNAYNQQYRKMDRYTAILANLKKGNVRLSTVFYWDDFQDLKKDLEWELAQ